MPRKRKLETEDARSLRRVEHKLKAWRQWIAAERESLALRTLMRDALRKSQQRAVAEKRYKRNVARGLY